MQEHQFGVTCRNLVCFGPSIEELSFYRSHILGVTPDFVDECKYSGALQRKAWGRVIHVAQVRLSEITRLLFIADAEGQSSWFASVLRFRAINFQHLYFYRRYGFRSKTSANQCKQLSLSQY